MTRCLVADDSEIIRKIARHILESMSYEVLEAANGRQTVDCCLESNPRILLLGARMSDMDTVDVLGELRNAELEARPHIIYCTTENDVSEISRAFVAGANDYLLKPFDRESLQASLAAAQVS